METATGRRRRRRLRWTAAVVAGMAGVLFGGPAAIPDASATTPQGAPMAHPSGDPFGPVPNPIDELPTAPSAAGAISAADRDLVIKVRLAGLWEMPASEMAASKGTSPRVREVGRAIGPQHATLDAMTQRAAVRLGITLPNEPNTDQKGWLAEMQRASGPQFDRIYVDRLRAAHGKVFPAIAAVRSSTRNDVVRQLAAQANSFVLTHMTLLESTGLVDYDSLPQAPPPAPAAAAAAAAETAKKGTLLSSSGSGVSPAVIWIVLAAALVAGAYSTVRLIRPR